MYCQTILLCLLIPALVTHHIYGMLHIIVVFSVAVRHRRGHTQVVLQPHPILHLILLRQEFIVLV